MIWKEIKEYPGYFISDDGQVKTTGIRPGLLKASIERGYKRVHLMNGKKGRSISHAHRIVSKQIWKTV